MVRPANGFPCPSFGVAVSCRVVPTGRESEGDVTTTVTTGFGGPALSAVLQAANSDIMTIARRGLPERTNRAGIPATFILGGWLWYGRNNCKGIAY